MQEIQTYLFCINGVVNPNMKDATRMNPIAVRSTKQELRTLQDELDLYELDIQLINVDAILRARGKN